MAIGYRPTDMDVLDIYVGLRYDAIDLDLDFTGAIIDRSAGDKLDWVDPVVGMRARFPLNDDWAIEMSAFYSTGKADYTAVGNIGVRWQFGEKWSSTLTYRYSAIDYDDDIGFQETTSGPILVFGYKF